MAKKQVTDEQFNALREQLAQAECATKTIPLASIQLDDKSFSRGEIQVAGSPIRVSRDFFPRFASMLKVSRSLTSEMIKNEDGKLAASMMNGLKEYRQSRGNHAEVVLIANPNSREIIDVCDPRRMRRMTNESVLDITTRLVSDNPKLTIETVDFNPHRGTAIINLLNGEEVGFPGAGKDEFFKFGFSIIQTSKDTSVEMYNQRLVCSNGLRVSLGQGAIGGNSDIQFAEHFKLGGNSAEEIRIFLNQIDAMSKAGFIPGAFQGTLLDAVNTRASLYEVESAMIAAQRLVREDDPNLKKSLIDSLSRNYFHSHADTMARIARKGHDTLRLNDKQKSFIKTSQSVWDVVNSLTYLGSNNSGLQLSNDRTDLKARAGVLFGKGTSGGYDLQFSQLASL